MSLKSELKEDGYYGEEAFLLRQELKEKNKLLDVLVKVGIKDYVKEIIYYYELDEDEQKLLEDFIK